MTDRSGYCGVCLTKLCSCERYKPFILSEPRILRIVIESRVPSVNRKSRFEKRDPMARRFAAVAIPEIERAVAAAGWVPPACARVGITVWNTAIDADNVSKSPVDLLKGLAIIDDKREHLRGISVEHDTDDGPRRIEIKVVPCDPPAPVRSFAKRGSRPVVAVRAESVEAVERVDDFATVQAEARRREAKRGPVRYRSGDVVGSFAERDRILREAGVTGPGTKRR